MNSKYMWALAGVGLLFMFQVPATAADAGSVVLDATGVKNLGIQTVVAEEESFTETVFALGRIESIPTKSGSVSSRISGRLVNLGVAAGDTVTEGQVVAKVESRQPGDPPPVIALSTPVGGLVIKSESKLGDPVEPDKPLVEIVDLSEIYAISRVPEYQAGSLKPGAKARIRIPALGEREYEGKMLRFGTIADQESGTIDAVFLISNQDLGLRPGMRAEFDIILSHRENVLSVPKDAIQGNPANRHVYVKDITVPNAFVKAPVQLGAVSGDKVEVISGVFPGDEVVTRGSYALGFAGGGGGVSLKEALDAAHGHNHNEDGSEMSPEQAAAAGKKGGNAEGHDHGGRASGFSSLEIALMISTGVLTVLLVAMAIMQWRTRNNS